MEDERITAWETIVWHPFFKGAFDNDGVLIDSMIELLDKAVSLPSKGEKMSNFTGFKTEPDFDGDYVEVIKFDHDVVRNGVQLTAYDAYNDRSNSVVLTLKDVAALHKALGDHLEANGYGKLPKGVLRFLEGVVAVWNSELDTWEVINSDYTYTDAELLHNFGDQWEELVVK